jgi:vacuolar-type H+-ATPase subunit E/Vma4
VPLAELIQALERDASAEVSTELAAAAADAARTEATAQREHADRIASTLASTRSEQRALHDARLADATLHARTDVLRARASMLERLLPEVRNVLPELARDPRVASTLRAAAQACSGGSGRVEELPTGVVVELADGTRIDATLEAFLEREWPRLAPVALAFVAEVP